MSLRRQWLQRVLAVASGSMSFVSSTFAASNSSATTAPKPEVLPYPPVVPGVQLDFPRDFGAHPDYRTEWWYLTGWLQDGTLARGFQVTFFRTRTRHSSANPSRFAPTQLIFGHAALASAANGRLLHDQRAARVGMGHAEFSTHGTFLRLGDWSLQLHDGQRYTAAVRTREFDLDLELTTPDAPWLQGERGYSRKGPRPEQASYYYSRPQLLVRAQLSQRGSAQAGLAHSALGGIAWLDHEWSSEILDQNATGWDWVGLNLDNGDALVAFVIRPSAQGAASTSSTRLNAIWSHAAIRSRSGLVTDFGRDVTMTPVRTWVSPRTAVRYPVAMAINLPGRTLTLEPLLDDQELDSRASTGAIYWEGAVRVNENGRQIGAGYLELTGYGERLRL